MITDSLTVTFTNISTSAILIGFYQSLALASGRGPVLETLEDVARRASISLMMRDGSSAAAEKEDGRRKAGA